MKLEINSVHEAYELKRSLDERLEGHMKRIEGLENQERFLKSLRIDLDVIDKTVGWAIASKKRDARTNLELTEEIRKIIEVMKG